MKRAHSYQGRVANYVYCVRCGLILFNNKRSRKRQRKPCRNAET